MRIRTLSLIAMAWATTLSMLAQQAIRGRVADPSGEPLAGVTVIVDGKPVTATDIDGNFSLPQAKPSSKVEISFIGFKNQSMTVGHQTVLSFVMEEDNKMMDEVLVVGYGTMRKTDLTGSVSSVDTKKLNQKGAVSVLSNLQGSIPGVSITQNTGRTGGGFGIEIRGKNSISSDQSPLYVVDGVICDNIDFLNPQDIERIDVLKDASSTAIYGSRATAGVVMVTTKSGSTTAQKGIKPTVSYDGYFGISKVARMPDFMNGEEFYRYRFFKFLQPASMDFNGGRPMMINGDVDRCLLLDNSARPFDGNHRMKELLAAGQTYNWRDYVLQDGQQQNHYLSVSGSSESINYHIGVGYDREVGVYKNDEQDKFSLKGSIDAKLNKYITAGFSFNGARIDHDYASDKAVKIAFRLPPFAQPYDADGKVIHKPGNKDALGTDFYAFTSQSSPLVYMDTESKNNLQWVGMSNVYLQFNILKGLTFKTTFSPMFSYSRTGYFQGIIPGEIAENEAQRKQSQSFSYTWDNMVTYDTNFGKDHHLNVMGLVSSMYANSESEELYYKNVQEGTAWWNIGTSDQGYNYGKSLSGYGENSLLSYALRANYTFKQRYMLTGTIRWDGSSKFAKGNRWDSFPSVGAAWRLSEESFMQDRMEWLSNLKLRASYGVTGNNNVGNYATHLGLAGPVYYPYGTTYVQGMYPAGIIDRDIRWEKSHEFNVGLDFGFLRDRIRGSVDYYNKKSEDLLYSVELPLESGGGTMQTNIGSVRNRGIEVELTTENVRTRNWRWSTTFTFAHNSNKVLEINGTGNAYSGNATGNLFIGQPFNNVYCYVWDGLVTDGDMIVPDHEIARVKGFTPGTTVKQVDYYNACYNLIEGNPIIRDKNGDGRFNDEDKQIYKSDPDWIGSFTSNLEYKGWDLSFSLYAKIGYKVFSNFYSEYYNYGNSARGNNKLNADFYIPAGTMIDCDGRNPDGTFKNPVYQETTHHGSFPFLSESGASNDGFGNPNWLGNANSLADASFVKVKHISLGYTLPKQWTDACKCSLLRLYCTVTNPFVFTDYKGYDPEWADTAIESDGPSTITWQFGVNVKF